MEKRGQIAVEFLITVGILLFFLVLFLIALEISSNEKNYEKESILVNEIGLSIKNEIDLAYESSNGYYREFNIPNTIFNKEYILNYSGNRIYLRTGKIGASFLVLNYTGNISKGTNVIEKKGGEVFIYQ